MENKKNGDSMIQNKIQIVFSYPSETLDEIYECLKTLYSTPLGTVPLNRDFGLNWNLVDLPIEIAKAKITIEIIEKTRKYEPRVEVQKVSFDYDGEQGLLKPKVVVAIV